jgi:glycosyl-4,4'-diaponeurosporenoate acyltransferase
MILYGLFFLISLALTLILNLIFKANSANFIVTWFVILFLIEVAIDAIVAIVIHKLPQKMMNPSNKIYKVYKWERKFYEKLGIRKWKGLVPETGQLCNFKKDKLYDPNSSEYLYKFMVETCYAEVMHFMCAILSFSIMFIPLGKLTLTLCLPISFINSITQLLPALIQRYVRPRIAILYKRRLTIENSK